MTGSGHAKDRENGGIGVNDETGINGGATGTGNTGNVARTKLSEFACVGLGCAIGAVLRWLVQQAVAPWTYDDVAIMVVNILGCAVLGLVTAFVTQRRASPLLKKFLTTGFCGGLTTFSSFCGDTFQMLQSKPGLALAFVAGNMVLGLAAYCLAGCVRFRGRKAEE